MSTVSWSLRDPQHGVGVGFPVKAALPAPAASARDVGLDAFASWIATLRFLRAGNRGGPPIPFRIPKARVHTEQPDSVEDLKFPSAVFIPQRGQYVRGLGGGELLDETIDVYGKGSAVLLLGQYTELMAIESWSSKRAERRAIIAALETAMMLGEGSMALRLALPGYFDSTVVLSLEEQERIDDLDTARNRRKGRLYVQMTIPVARLVNAITLLPYVVDLTGEADLDSDLGP